MSNAKIKPPEPLKIGTVYGRSKVAEVVATDLTDDCLPYCYRLENGQQVWIPASYVADERPSGWDPDGCNCESCRADRMGIDDDDEEIDSEWDEDDDDGDDQVL